jgi:hypothetical protein
VIQKSKSFLIPSEYSVSGLGLAPLFERFFPRIMLISDVISSVLTPRDFRSHVLIPRSRVILEKLRVDQLVKKFPVIYETMFTTATGHLLTVMCIFLHSFTDFYEAPCALLLLYDCYNA